MTCQLGYKDRPCTFRGQAAHYFITVYRDTNDCWSVRTEYHSGRGWRGQRKSNANAKHFTSYDEARAWAVAKHAQWTKFPEGLPVAVELGEALQ